ncbi:MAG: hypothetical protein A2600_12705 [Candidatus Lambdaproteobacteria bacterium RIFOXYD1_FULL_56_27]|uniref:Uncharacterized protein n=1 Tax=Candidatus Lambdaproteobacteria bacterium RIFOXYD2_FULL_56_26 TaxID=1817773 RepID=A0A1F6GTU5_9PROT|nr:MAG: hypothetical protein A2426_06595 [Candidatus Lambdaproteobacteria bacterium RIFOXYC1_FULL_56_13]OGH01573.1 MAG: hypothetical protein A2557_04030 [Candidatus Lambdaproteobacteria bacterium RIFOXYD2_FULL_56_26]OGH07182.1 MAG: hypothetical protein A2600_12705 [Candidatus Lambdaproteobacteria bacterium RIFOXYD1_FULL_56_27]
MWGYPIEPFERTLQLGKALLSIGPNGLRLTGCLTGEGGVQLLDRFFELLGEQLSEPRGEPHFLEICFAEVGGPCEGLLQTGLDALEGELSLGQNWLLLWGTPPQNSKAYYRGQGVKQRFPALCPEVSPAQKNDCGDCPALCFGSVE